MSALATCTQTGFRPSSAAIPTNVEVQKAGIRLDNPLRQLLRTSCVVAVSSMAQTQKNGLDPCCDQVGDSILS